MIPFTTLDAAATEALSPPPEFPTSDPHSSPPTGPCCQLLSVRWDSDLIDQPNWEVISRDLLDRFSGECSHPAQPDVPDIYVSLAAGAARLMVRIKDKRATTHGRFWLPSNGPRTSPSVPSPTTGTTTRREAQDEQADSDG